VAKRVINKYNPAAEELDRVTNRGRGSGKKASDSAGEDQNIMQEDDGFGEQIVLQGSDDSVSDSTSGTDHIDS
jgi:hypothetical protein